MAIGNNGRKGNGGVISSPPIPAHEALRKLEKRYAAKCEEVERANKMISNLQAKLERLKCRTK
jgi:hypothetical protein